MATPTRPPGDDQDRWADEASQNVKKQAFFMKRALDDNNLHEGLKNASNMLFELRTSKLSPQNYYELYINVTDELRHLEAFIEDETKRSEGGSDDPKLSLSELYETVQHAGNIIPRLYLLITVGAVYIKTQLKSGAPAMEILFDLVEMTKGVQHPMRGLFLRNYLSQISKDKLPDAPAGDHEQNDEVKESIEFVLQNFGEMTRLWVRMQHQGAVRDRTRREKERQNLRMLVGTNLVRLSQLQAVDKEIYQEKVLPRIVEQVVKCKDTIAQEYLMDCIIQVFPDDFHLATLEIFLGAVSKLQQNVNVKDIIIALMNRLSNYARETPENIPDELQMFPLFQKYSKEVINANEKMVIKDVLSIQVALINFATKCYPDERDYVDAILSFSAEILSKNAEAGEESLGPAGSQVMKLLTTPLETLLLQVLDLGHYPDLMSYLDYEKQRKVSTEILQQLLKAKNKLTSSDQVEKLLTFVAPIIKDQDNTPELSDDNKFEFEEEQHLVARFVHLVQCEDTDEHFKCLAVARKHFGVGGPQRIIHTLGPLVFCALALIRRVYQREQEEDELLVKSKKIFQFIHEIVHALGPHSPNLALRLFLQGAMAADQCQYEPIAYEFIVQSFSIYEEEIADSGDQYRAINLIAGTLQQSSNFDRDNYETLCTKATQHSSKLLKKPEQARSVYNCANLFWRTDPEKSEFCNAKTVLHCLQRSLKIANTIMEDTHKVHIFIEILNRYIFFYEHKCESIKAEYLTNLIALIEEHLSGLDNETEADLIAQASAHYRLTLDHIRHKQREGDEEIAERFAEISL